MKKKKIINLLGELHFPKLHFARLHFAKWNIDINKLINNN